MKTTLIGCVHAASAHFRPAQLLAASLSLPAALLAFSAQATPSPASGTISSASSTLSYNGGGPFVVPNPTDALGGTGPVPSSGLCGPDPANPCDNFALALDLPANYKTTNPGATVTITISWPDPTTTGLLEFDAFLLDATGANVSGGSGAQSGVDPNVITFNAGQGRQTYTIQVEPFLPGAQNYSATVTLNPTGGGGGGSSGGGSSGGGSGGVVPGLPRYYSYVPGLGLGDDSGEPSIGYDPNTKHALYQAVLQTLDVQFPDNFVTPLPASCDASWTDVSYLVTRLTTLDPILFTDRGTGRTFVSQLNSVVPPGPTLFFVGLNSYFAFTDTDGEGTNAVGQPNWTPGQIGPPSGGYDHQTVGAGPYPSPLPPNVNPIYPDAVYYCSQGPLVAVEVAYCSRSDDGGLTFGPGVPAYTSVNTPLTAGCSNLHGHIKVAADGTVYVPSDICGQHQGVAISGDAGLTWTVSTVPSSQASAGSDPSIGIATDGTVYYCYRNADGHPHVAVSNDKGQSWINDFDIGASFGIQNSVFPAAVAGDPDRAACGFIGTPTGGDYQSGDFKGVWYPYLATTYDHGKTWTTANATPANPVQGAGGICTSGIKCSGTNRNLLDFNDLTIDEKGRPLFGFTHGCVGDCVQDPINKNSFASKATIVRQSGGKTLFAANDPVEPAVPQQACLAGHRDDTGTYLRWHAADNGGSELKKYNIYRLNPDNTHALIGSTHKTVFNDRSVDPNVTHYGYTVTAVNAVGEGPASNALTLPVGPRLEDTGVCATPGITVVQHAAGKETDGQAQHSIEAVQVAEPQELDGKLVFTLQMQDLSGPLTPFFRWAVRFTPPRVPASTATNTVEDFFVSMVTADGPNPTFTYGTTGVQQGETRTFTTLGNLDSKSNYNAQTGAITLIVDKANIGSPAPGEAIKNILGSVRVTGPSAVPSTGGVNQTIPDSTGPGQYTMRSAKLCLPNPPPVALLHLSPASGTAPLDVMLDGSGSTDSNTDDTIASYTFNFGDGSDEVTQSAPSITHRYQNSGMYAARLLVTNSRGKLSQNVDRKIVDATGSGSSSSGGSSGGGSGASSSGGGSSGSASGGTSGGSGSSSSSSGSGSSSSSGGTQAPVASLQASPVNGVAPLAVSFDASASSDPNSGGSITSYSFNFGDNSPVVSGSNAKTSHSYSQPGTYTASVTVTDSEGGQASQSLLIRVQSPQNDSPTVSLAVNTTNGTAPLTVNFDASGSYDSTGSITNYLFDFGDGSSKANQTTPTVSHVYNAAGTYQASVTVTNNFGNSAAAYVPIQVSTSITVTPSNAPVAELSVSPSSGSAPLTVTLDGSKSFDPDGTDTIASYTFDFGDGSAAVTQTSPTVNHVYTQPGTYQPSLSVVDSAGTHSAVAAVAKAYVTPASSTGGGTSGGSAGGGGGAFAPGVLLSLLLGAALRRKRSG